jgi:two-component system chemotaxis sensor kinase CheA
MANAPHARLRGGKYRPLLTAIVLFGIVVATVLTANFLIAREVADDALGVNLSGRQRMLSQRITKTLLQIDRPAESTEVTPPIEELRNAFALFDSTLLAFERGGETRDATGAPTRLRAVSTPQARAAVEAGILAWAPIRAALLPLTAESADVARLAPVGRAAAERGNLDLLKAMNDLTVALEVASAERATLLRTIQVAGMSVALLLFGYIVFFALRSLRRQDAALDAANRETDGILATMNDGLFLLDRDLKFGVQQSTALRRILGDDRFEGRTFGEVMRNLIDGRTLSVAEDFIRLLTEGRVKEKLVAEINPLTQVELSVARPDGTTEQRFVAFRFQRVAESAQVMATVADITREVELAREVDKARAEREGQIELLASLMHVDSAQLASFMRRTTGALDEINGTLADAAGGRIRAQNALNAIARHAHRIKGDAAAIDLSSITAWAHRFENAADQLRASQSVSGEDVLSLTVELKEMYQLLSSIRTVTQRLESVRQTISDSSTATPAVHGGAARDPLAQLAQSVAERENKAVALRILGSAPETAPLEVRDALASGLAQLVRNAVTHGVEPAEARVAAGKPALAEIAVAYSRLDGGALQVSVRDDGAGIDFDAIRRRATSSGLMDAATAAAADQRSLVALLFRPGFSTRAEAGLDAGRGQGLDVVKALFDEVGARLRIITKPGWGTEFIVSIPAERMLAREAAHVD